MRNSIILSLLLLFFFYGSVLAQSDEVMADLKHFEQTSGGEQIDYANSFMNKLYQEEFINHLQRYDDKTSLDTIRKHVYFAAAEYAFYELADYKQAIHYGSLALETMTSSKELSLEGECESMLAVAYFRQSDFIRALEHAHRDLAIQRKKADASSISSALNTIAGIYLASRNEKEALEYVLQAIEFSTLAKDSSRMGIQKGMASEILLNLNKYEEALQYAEAAFLLDSLRGNRPKMGIRLSQQASPLMKMKRYDEAKRVLNRAIPILTEYKIGVSLAICQNQLGYIANLQCRYDEAAQSFRKSLAYFVKHHDLLNELRARQGLSVALRESDPTEAMVHMDRISVLKDSLYDHEMETALSKAHASFKNEQLASQNEHHRIEKRLFMIAAVAVFVVLAFLLAYLSLLVRKYKRTAEEDKLLAEEVESMDVEVVLSPEEEQFIRKLNEFIDTHMEDFIEVDALARYMSLGHKQLNRRLSQIIGCNASTYIIRRRIDRACDLLLNSNNKISDIALSCGFDNPSNFARTFKDVQGCPPSVFRKEHLVK